MAADSARNTCARPKSRAACSAKICFMVVRICGVPRTTADRARAPRRPSAASSTSSRISAAMVSTQPCVSGTKRKPWTWPTGTLTICIGLSATTRPSSVASPPPRSIRQHLVQPGMAVHGQRPVVQHRAGRDRLAMHDIRQVAGLAEQVVDPDGRGGAAVLMFELYKTKADPSIGPQRKILQKRAHGRTRK